MESLLICSFALASALFAVGLATSASVRLPRPGGIAVPVLTVVLLAALFAGFALFSVLAREPGWAMACALGFVVGTAAVVLLGRRPASPGLPPRAELWPLPRLAVLFVLSLAIFVTAVRNARLGAQQDLASRRAELASLEQVWWPGVPPALNAAPVYERAYERLVPLDGVPGAHAAFDAVWEKNDQGQLSSPALAEWVRRNEAALALGVEGTHKPGYASVEDALWRGSPFGHGREGKILRLEMARAGHDPSTVDNQLSRRRLGDLLQTRALQRAAAGSFDAAVDDVNALLALADQTWSPWLRPERAVEKLLAAKGFPAAALAGLHVPRSEGLDARLQRLFVRGEHAQLELWDSFARGRDPLDTAFKATHEALWARRSLASMARTWDELWEAAYAPAQVRLQRLREAEARGEAQPGGQLWAARVAPGVETILRSEAARGSARAGVAIARYRLAHGAFPERLEQLVPDLLDEVPRDPFDGAPLRYRVAGEDARVYSVGADLRDGGGEQAGDLVFTVPNPR